MQGVIPFWRDGERTPVVQAWYHVGVVGTGGRHANARGQRAEHTHAADRFAREIVGFLTLFVVRSRRLMGIPFGVRDEWVAIHG